MVFKSICRSESTIMSAAERSSAVAELVTAMHLAPAALAAWTPLGASSKTTQRAGGIPIRRAARRKISGSGFLRLTWLPSTQVICRLDFGVDRLVGTRYHHLRKPCSAVAHGCSQRCRGL